jgi:protein TonB
MLSLAAAGLGGATGASASAARPFEQPPWPAAGHAERATLTVAPDIDIPTYQRVLARHLYEAYPGRVWRGMLRPMLHAVMFTEVQLDQAGRVVHVTVLREPAGAPEVAPWLRQLIRRAAPYPMPEGMGAGTLWWREVWLVDRSGQLQAMSLSEGQR